MSGRMVLSLLSFLEQRGIARAAILQTVGHPEVLGVTDLDWVDWSTYVAIIEGASATILAEEWRAAGHRLFQDRRFGRLSPVVRWTVPSIESAYDWLLHYLFGPDAGGFRGISVALMRIRAGHLRLVLRPPRRSTLPIGLLKLTEGTLEIVPTLVGGARAIVVLKRHRDDAVFDITFEERPLALLARRLLRLWWPGAADAARLRDSFDQAMEQSASQRREKARRKLANQDDSTGAAIVPRLIDGKYRLIRLLGSGSMGKVYLANQEPGDRRVAIKVLAVNPEAHGGSHESHQRMFFREADALARLSSRYIVKLHDYGMDRGLPFLVLQHVEGAALEDLMITGAFPVQDAEKIFRQVVKALRDAHARGIMHRDLSPANVIIDRYTGAVTVLDFGLSKFQGDLDSLSAAGRVVGTTWYVAPETLQGHADVRADLYAAGMILYRMLTGRFPYDAKSADVMAAHLTEAPRSFRDAAPHRRIPKRLERIAMRCLEKDPNRRFPSAVAVLHALEQRPEPWPGLLPALITALIVMSLLVLVLSGLLLL